MSSLKSTEQRKLEDLFGMRSGYVLDFSNNTFQKFIFENSGGIDIYSNKYSAYGDSKAKRLRSFWEQERDALVGYVIKELLEEWTFLQTDVDAWKKTTLSTGDSEKYKQCLRIAHRLQQGKAFLKEERVVVESKPDVTVDEFIKKHFDSINIEKLRIEDGVKKVIQERIDEAITCLSANAPLSTILLSASALEGLLLGVALNTPELFNTSSSSPKNKDGKVKKFPEWSLCELINTSYELGFVTLDVKKFSHVMRDFRNYIHPHQQYQENFKPTKDTSTISLQVLKAVISNLLSDKRISK